MSDAKPVKIPAWKELAPKQVDLIRLCRKREGKKKYIGVFGTRLSGKTTGVMHAMADHMWMVDNARVLILVPTQGSGMTSGIWNEFTEKILPSWMESEGIDKDDPDKSMAWAPKGEPRANIAKKMVAATNNAWGGKSTVELDSLDNEEDVEDKFKNRYFTMIVWCEAGEYKNEKTLTTLMLALRGQNLKPDDFVLLVDANPPDEGEDHFLYKYFYELRLRSDEQDARLKAIQECLHVTEWSMMDNPYLSETEKNATMGIYMNDPDLYDRYIRGMWKRAIRDALFAGQFKKAIHVLGGPMPRGEQQLLLPSEGCTELITGHDAGGVNPVSYILEELVFNEQIKNIDGQVSEKQIRKFQFLDELAFIGGDISPAEFTKLMLEKMDFWEQELQHEVIWYHYADSSALNQKESIAQRTVADEMFIESEGRIRLIGVEKGRGSVGLRIRLFRRLLMEQRVFISGMKCPKLIEMCQCIKRGRTEGTIATGTPHKHPFDAATYPLVKILWQEIHELVRMIHKKKNPDSGGLMVI